MDSVFHVPLARFAVFTVGHHSNLVRPRSIHCSLLLSPEVLKAIGRQFGVAHRVVGRLSPAVGVLAAMGEAETTQPRDMRCRPANYRPTAAGARRGAGHAKPLLGEMKGR